MGATQLNMLKLLLLLTFTEIIATGNDLTFSVFTVTSKSITIEWSGPTGASSYRTTATPKNLSNVPVFTHVSGYTVMTSVDSLSPNTMYTVQLEALDNDSNVLSRASTEETTAPEVPRIIEAYSKQSYGVTVVFTEAAGATSYILRAEAEDFFLETTVSSSPGTIVFLQPYTNYMISVMSVNSGGRSQPSYSVKAKTVVTAPQLNATSPDNSTMVVTWPPVENAVFYKMRIIKQGFISYLDVNTTDTMLILDNLEGGTTYCLKATAYDSEGRPGDDIHKCQITRPQTPDLSYVELLQGRSFGLTVYWEPVQGAETYMAYTSNGQNCSSTYDPVCYILSVECGENHTVSVTAYNSAGPSSPSEPFQYITHPCPPENVWMEEPEPSNCSLKWNEVLLVEYYVAFMKRDDGMELLCNTTKTSCSFFCMCGHMYFTSVFPHNSAGASPYSPISNYTTIPCCPEDVIINLISTETLEIVWSPVNGAELYETTAEEATDMIQCNDTAPVCTLSDLRCNTVYSVTVTPCSEIRGCNHTCTPHTHETAPCSPEILNMTQTDSSTYRVLITNPNTDNTNYTITATGHYNTHTCKTSHNYCDLTQLPCGSVYEVLAVATTAVGQSLPGFSETLETGPCCPTFVNVNQVTQAMTNVTWAPAAGARSYITALTSLHGHAKCHTLGTQCLMGCITCSTNYSITLEAISSTGHKSECTYQGFSSSPCCPIGIKLYRNFNNSLRVHWRSLGPRIHSHTVHMNGTGANYTCTAPPATTYCDIQEIQCGNVYTVVVIPTGQNNKTVNFCQPMVYSVPCPGSILGISPGWKISS